MREVYAIFLSVLTPNFTEGVGALRTSRKHPAQVQTDMRIVGFGKHERPRFRKRRKDEMEGGTEKGLSWDPDDIFVVVACRRKYASKEWSLATLPAFQASTRNSSPPSLSFWFSSPQNLPD